MRSLVLGTACFLALGMVVAGCSGPGDDSPIRPLITVSDAVQTTPTALAGVVDNTTDEITLDSALLTRTKAAAAAQNIQIAQIVLRVDDATYVFNAAGVAKSPVPIPNKTSLLRACVIDVDGKSYIIADLRLGNDKDLTRSDSFTPALLAECVKVGGHQEVKCP